MTDVCPAAGAMPALRGLLLVQLYAHTSQRWFRATSEVQSRAALCVEQMELALALETLQLAGEKGI